MHCLIGTHSPSSILRTYISLFPMYVYMLNKNTPGVKKSEAKSEAPVSSYSCMRLKSVTSGGGQGLSCLASNNVGSLSEGSVSHISMVST